MLLLHLRRWLGRVAGYGLLALLPSLLGMEAAATPTASLGIQHVEGSETTSSSQARGYRFRAEQDLQVTGLAIYDVDGDGLGIQGHYVLRLWTDAGAQLASATLGSGTGAPLVQGFRVAEVTPLVLTAGQIYRLSADYGFGSGGPELVLKPDVIVTHPAITLIANVGVDPATLEDFGLLGPNGGFPGTPDHPTIGPNLVFTLVPEPGTGLLLACGLLALGARRRGVRGKGSS